MHAFIEYLNQPTEPTRINLHVWDGDELIRVYRNITEKRVALGIAEQRGAEVV